MNYCCKDLHLRCFRELWLRFCTQSKFLFILVQFLKTFKGIKQICWLGYYEIEKSVGWTIDKFRLDNSLAINGTILRFAYWKIDVQRRTFANFWDFCCSYHQIMTVWILVLEGRDKKGGFVEMNSSKYSISKSKMQGIFESGFASHTAKYQNKTQDHLNYFSINKIEGKLYT